MGSGGCSRTKQIRGGRGRSRLKDGGRDREGWSGERAACDEVLTVMFRAVRSDVRLHNGGSKSTGIFISARRELRVRIGRAGCAQQQ